MKNKIILTNLAFITLLGCNASTNTEVKPSTSPSISTTSSHSNIISSTSIRPDDIYCNQVYCKPISNDDIDNPKIIEPFDLAVSNDGKNVFVVNKRLYSDPSICGTKDTSKSTQIPRSFIYKISSDKKITTLKINDSFDYSCQNREFIESDKNDNLYSLKNTFNSSLTHSQLSSNPSDSGIQTSNISLLKINNSYNIEKELPLKKEELINYNYRVNQLNVSKIDNSITYSQTPFKLELSKTANKINEDGSIDTLYIYQGFGGSGVAPFIFDDNKLNFGTSYYKGKYPYIDSSNSSYEGFNRIVPLDKNLAIRTMKMNSKKEIFALAYTKGVQEINRIYKIVPDQGFEVFAGSEEAGYKDGNGTEARFNNPSSIDFDANDNMYVADTDNNAIRKITPNGDVTTFFKQN